jgi:hypothetical protein
LKSIRLVELLTKLAYEQKGYEASDKKELTDLDQIIRCLMSTNEWSNKIVGKLLEVSTKYHREEVSEKSYLGMLQILTHYVAKGSLRFKQSNHFEMVLQLISNMIEPPRMEMKLDERILHLKLNKMALMTIKG